jgi:hypothetical protein
MNDKFSKVITSALMAHADQYIIEAEEPIPAEVPVEPEVPVDPGIESGAMTDPERISMIKLARDALLVNPDHLNQSDIANLVTDINAENAESIADTIHSICSIEQDIDATPEVDYNNSM